MEKTPTANIKTIEQKKKFKVAIVDTTDLMRSQAEDTGNEKMTIEAESAELAKLSKWEKLGKGEYWSRLGQKVWKYGMKRDYNLNKEIAKACQEILKTDNVFAGEGKEKASHDKVMTDILNQFTSGYDEAVHKDAGEKKIEIGGNELEEEATGDKESVKQLIMDWATGKISKESFLEQEKRIFHNLKGNVDEEKIKGNTMYASNLFEIAEQVKLAIENKEFLDNEDLDIDLIYGKSKANVRTEAHYSQTERLVNKMLHTKVGQFANETSISIALSCAYHLMARSVVTLPGKLVPILGTAVFASLIGKERGQIEAENKRVSQSRLRAKGEVERGKKFDPTTMPNRAEIDVYNYKTESAGDLIKNIDTNINLLGTKGKDTTEQELNSVFSDLAAVEALIRLSDRRHIDLVTYSDSTKVVEERLTLDIKRRQMKDALEKAFKDGNHTTPNGKSFEEYFNSLATTEENRLISEEGTGIDAKDQKFNSFKKDEGVKAAKTAFATGLFAGVAMSELFAGVDGLWGGHRVGVVEDIAHQIKGDHVLPPGVTTENLTLLAEVKHLFQGDLPKMSMGNIHEVLVGENHIKLPEGVDMIKNSDGTYNLVGGGKVFGENLTMGPNGSLSEEAKNILAHNGVGIENHLVDGVTEKKVGIGEYIKSHLPEMKKFHRLGWFDNNTKGFDLNELKTEWGGLNGSGVDANGNYVLNVGHMTADGSFHGDLSANAQELMKAGKLKMLFSMSNGTQNQAFEFTVTPKGEIIIPPGSEAGRIAFSNIAGHANFLGRFGEVAQDMGDDNYRILGTLEGKGLDDVIDKVKIHTEETILTTPGNYEGGTIPVVAVVPGKPNEKLTKEEKKKEEDKKIEGKEIIKEVSNSQEKDSSGDIILGPTLSLSKEEKDKNKALEISQEEYDGMNDDLKMLNKKILESKGIINLEGSDFKSEYGKRRYMDLKSIKGNRSKGFNITENELQTMGDEFESRLSSSKKINLTEVHLRKNEYERDYEKSKEDEKNIFAEFKKFTEEHPDDKIPEEMEDRYRKAEEKLRISYAKFNEAEKETAGDNFTISEDGEIIRKDKESIPVIEKVVEENKEVRAIKKEIESQYKKESETIKSETKESSSKKERLYTFTDLLKVGTEFKSEGNSYIVVKAPKSRSVWNMFSTERVEVIATDKKGKESLFSFTKKYLENKFKKGNVKITKTLEGNKK